MMEFVYKNWDMFCRKLAELNIFSVTSSNVLSGINTRFLILKHDVETKVKNAYRIAQIEHKYGHRGSYYVQAYLLKSSKNVKLLREMQSMGHEISYHYDVMDSCKGDIDSALKEFRKNVSVFLECGFPIATLCQHGNPLIERKGYTSNRDFFRNPKIQALYPNMTDIMVDFKTKAKCDYVYISDAGRQFNIIFDPINNDIVKSDDKDIFIKSFDELIEHIKSNNCILSIHPHRWVNCAVTYKIRNYVFKFIKSTVNFAYRVPGIKKIINKFYFLAKKI